MAQGYFVASAAAPTDVTPLTTAQQQVPLFALRATLTYTEAITISPLMIAGGGTYVVDLTLLPETCAQGILVKYGCRSTLALSGTV